MLGRGEDRAWGHELYVHGEGRGGVGVTRKGGGGGRGDGRREGGGGGVKPVIMLNRRHDMYENNALTRNNFLINSPRKTSHSRWFCWRSKDILLKWTIACSFESTAKSPTSRSCVFKVLAERNIPNIRMFVWFGTFERIFLMANIR